MTHLPTAMSVLKTAHRAVPKRGCACGRGDGGEGAPCRAGDQGQPPGGREGATKKVQKVQKIILRRGKSKGLRDMLKKMNDLFNCLDAETRRDIFNACVSFGQKHKALKGLLSLSSHARGSHGSVGNWFHLCTTRETPWGQGPLRAGC